ncbi:MAG: class I SAM-dependent methyltransferase [Candidatus Izemoplasmataceae bacterium]
MKMHAHLFNQDAKAYHEARPSYPDEVIEWVVTVTEVKKEDTIIEVGAGTGKATKKFLERGLRIHAIELGSEMAKHLLLFCKGNISVDVTTFEDWSSDDLFQSAMVLSATAFHWVDPAIRYKKAHLCLKDDGHLVLLWNMALPTSIKEEKEAFEYLFSFHNKKSNGEYSVEEVFLDRYNEILASNLFEIVDTIQYEWSVKNTQESLIKGFLSQSSYLSLSKTDQLNVKNKITSLYHQIEEPILTPFLTMGFIAKKK